MAEAWLNDRVPGFMEVTQVADYAVWAFDHPVVGNGLLELINNPEISQGGAMVALSVRLMVAPPKTLTEALDVLRLNEWLCGCAIVFKEITTDGDLVVEGKFPLEELSCARLDKLLRVLTDSKHYLES